MNLQDYWFFLSLGARILVVACAIGLFTALARLAAVSMGLCRSC